MDVIHRIITDATGSSILDFGDSANAQIGRLKYNHASDTFSIYVNASERFSINSTGNISLSGYISTNGVIVGSAANTISGLATIINTGTLTLPTSTDTLVGRATSDTLTNKTMSGASNTFSSIADVSLAVSYLKADGTRPLTGNWNAGAFSGTFNSVIVGSAANTISGLATIINTGTLTLPTSTDTLVGRATSDTLTNKSMSGATNTFSNIADVSLAISYLKADGTRPLTGNWNAGAFSATHNSVIVGSAANTVSGLATIINTGTLTLPTSTDTLVGRATSDTLTNKTIVVANNTVTTAASGNLTSTSLNAALAELQSDIDTRLTSSSLTAHTSATAAHGVSGNIVGTSDNQTLTNKTIDFASNLISNGGATSGAVLFYSGTSLSHDPNFIFDSINKRLGIGVGSTPPTEALDIGGACRLNGGSLVLSNNFSVRWGTTHYFMVDTLGNWSFIHNSNPRLYISSTGEVTVGSTALWGKFSVYGSVNQNINVGNFWLTTASASASTPSPRSTNVSIYGQSAIVGSEFCAVSDRRLKQDISKLSFEDAFEFLDLAKPVSFQWKTDGNHDDYGFIAQDIVKTKFSRLVSYTGDSDLTKEIDEDGFISPDNIRLSVKYDSVVPILTAALKKVKEDNKILKDEIALLKERLTLAGF